MVVIDMLRKAILFLMIFCHTRNCSNHMNRYIDFDLAEKLRECEADLIILEGMGRAIHTNYLASFRCDSIKAAVIKNTWLANRLGGGMFSVVFKFESVSTNLD